MVEKMLVEKLPALQKFLGFLSKNSTALYLLLLLVSISSNVYLVKKVLDVQQETIEERQNSVDYERERAKSYEDIIKEQVRQPKIVTNVQDTLH